MRRTVLLVLVALLYAARLEGQTIPPQFSGLMLNEWTDYTTDPLVWTTPRVPSPGQCTNIDQRWKNVTCRIPTPTDCPVISSYNPTGDCEVTAKSMLIDYAKVSPWSVDGDYFVAMDVSGWLYLYSVNRQRFTFVRRLNTSQAKYGSTKDYGSSSGGHGLSGDWSNWLWANNPSTPHLIYYTGSSNTNPARFELKAYDVDADAISVVHDFSPTMTSISSAGTCAYKPRAIDMQREGNQSDDDRYWMFGVTDTSSSHWCAALTYDKTRDSIIAMKDFNANGMCGTNACSVVSASPYPNWVGVSPSGKYFIVNWQGGAYDSTWHRGLGTEVFDRDLNYLGVATGGHAHADVMLDASGRDVYVANVASSSSLGYSEISVCDLAQVSRTVAGPWKEDGTGGCQRAFQFPCSYSYAGGIGPSCSRGVSTANGQFISGRGSHGLGQGWVLWSSYADHSSSVTGRGGFGSLENLAVWIDWASGSTFYARSDVQPATVVRLSRTHDIIANASNNDVYSAQSNTVPNRDFTAFAWTSTWDTAPVDGRHGPYYVMYSFLGSDSHYTLNVHLEGGGTISGCAGSHAAGSPFTCTILPRAGWALIGSPSSTCGVLTRSGSTWSGTMQSSDCEIAAIFNKLTGSR